MLKYSRHEFKLSKESLRKIDSFLSKLHYSVMPSKIIRWLENFEEQELNYAYDLLHIFEYISFVELQCRLEDELKLIFNLLDKDENVLIVPYGKFGKSGTLVTYPISHTSVFRSNRKRIELSVDFEKCKKDVKSVIFIDDFIGSGDTFCKEYEKGIGEWIKEKNIQSVYVLAAVIMESGIEKIKKEYPFVQIFAQERKKAFSKESPLRAFKTLSGAKKITYKYGNKISVQGKPPFVYPYGYGQCEALVSFAHGTPNNTLPIFWGNDKWYPLYPRLSSLRMDAVRKYKKEIAFYIGICNRLGIDLYHTDTSIVVELDGKIKRKIKYNSKRDHSVVALVKLKLDGFEDIMISHILGLSPQDLREIYSLARKKRFVDSSGKLTFRAEEYYRQLKAKIRGENFRDPTTENLKPKGIIYVPRSFGGLT